MTHNFRLKFDQATIKAPPRLRSHEGRNRARIRQKLRTVKEHPALHYQAIRTHCGQFGSKIGSKNLMARPISAATQLQSRQDRQLLGPTALTESNSRSHAHAWRSFRRRNRWSPRYGRV